MSPGRRRASSRSGRMPAFVLAGGVGVILIGIVLLVGQLPSVSVQPEPEAEVATAEGQQTPPAPAAPPQAGTDEDARTITATLFYVAANGTDLVTVTRDVPYGATSAAQARRIAEAQLEPPPSGFFSAIAPGTTVRSVFLTPRGEAYLDLSRELITGHRGGSMNEELAVYALVNAMVVNLPDVSVVQILVEGQEIDSIAGHLDLRHPLRRSTERVRKGQ